SGSGIAVDAAGNVYFTGATNDTGFAVDTPEITPAGGLDAYVAHLGPAGGLVGAVRLGGSGNDFGNDVALDAGGNGYLPRTTLSTDFPTTPTAIQQAKPSRSDLVSAFATKLKADLSRLIYSTYLGGSGLLPVEAESGFQFDLEVGELGYAVAVDAGGSAYVVG